MTGKTIACFGTVERQTNRRGPTGWMLSRWPGPARVGIYDDSDKSLANQWIYHAGADTVLANSLSHGWLGRE